MPNINYNANLNYSLIVLYPRFNQQVLNFDFIQDLQKTSSRIMLSNFKLFFLFLFLLSPQLTEAQENTQMVLSLEEAIEIMESGHLLLYNSKLDAENIKNNKLGWLPVEPLSLEFYYGKAYSTQNDYIFEAQVLVGSIPAIIRHRKYLQQEIKLADITHQLNINELTKQLKTVYYQWLFVDKQKKVLEDLLQFFKNTPAEKELKNQESNLNILKEMEAAMLLYGLENEIKLLDAKTRKYRFQISELLMREGEWTPDHRTNEIYVIDFPGSKGEEFPGPGQVIDFYRQMVETEKERAKFEKAKLFPSLAIGAFKQQIGGILDFHGVYAGLEIPIWELISGSHKRNRNMNIKKAMNNQLHHEFVFQGEIDKLINELDAQHQTLQYHYAYVLPYSHALHENTMLRFSNNEINFDELFQNLRKVTELETSYLETLNKYNISAIELEYMIQ